MDKCGLKINKYYICLGWLKITGILLLLLTTCLLFLDIELSWAVLFNLPLYYIFLPEIFLTKKLSILVMPIIFNYVLWKRNLRTYNILHGIILVEKYKILLTMLLSYIGSVGNLLSDMPDYVLSAKISTTYFVYLILLLKIIETNGFKSIFYKPQNASKITNKMKDTYIVFFIVIFFIAFETLFQIVLPFYSAKIIKYNLPYDSFLTSISANTNQFVATAGMPDGDNIVSIYNLLDGSLVYDFNMKFATKSFLTPDNENVVVIKYNADPNSIDKYSIVNIRKNTDEKLNDPNNLLNKLTKRPIDMYIEKIHFSPGGKYFATEGGQIEVWNIQEKRLVALYDEGKKITSLSWLSDTKFVSIQDPKVDSTTLEGRYNKRVVYVDEINTNDVVKRYNKETISNDIQSKALNFKDPITKIKGNFEGNKVAIFVTGKIKNDIWNHQSYVDIWQIENEEKIFSYVSTHRIIDIEFHPDEEQIVLFEQYRDGKTHISFWDINQKIKRNELIAPKIDNFSSVLLNENGKNAIQYYNTINKINLF